MALKLYRVEFYDLRDVFHDFNILADSAAGAIAVLQEYFSNARVSVLFEIDETYTDSICYKDERALALNAYKYGFLPEIKNR